MKHPLAIHPPRVFLYPDTSPPYGMRSNPVYSRIGSGTSIDPSGRAPFSSAAISRRGMPNAEPFSVCGNLVRAPRSGRKRVLFRLVWKSPHVDIELTSSHSPEPGAHTSISYVFAD